MYINDQQSYKINKEFWCKLLHNITAFLTFYCFEQVWDCWYWCNTNQTCFKKFWLSCSSYLHRSQITVEVFLHCLRSACVYLIPFQVMEGEGKKRKQGGLKHQWQCAALAQKNATQHEIIMTKPSFTTVSPLAAVSSALRARSPPVKTQPEWSDHLKKKKILISNFLIFIFQKEKKKKKKKESSLVPYLNFL